MVSRRAFAEANRMIALLAGAIIASPLAASPITDALEGEWSGSGRLTLSSGETERIRCNGTARSTTANTVDQRFNCASTGKNFSFSSSLHFSSNRVRGSWTGSGRSGTVTGRATRSSVRARLVGADGTGNLSASISGCRQTLRITGWTDELRSLSVSLRKKC